MVDSFAVLPYPGVPSYGYAYKTAVPVAAPGKAFVVW